MRTDPHAIIRCIRPGLVLVAGAVIAGCCSDDVGSIDFYSVGDSSPMTVWVSDTVMMRADAVRVRTDWLCPMPLYTSETNVDRFSFSSSSPLVATIDSRGVVRATGVGVANLTATSAGVVSTPWQVTVVQPLAEIRLTATPAAPQVGDTITIRATPVDDAGSTVFDVTLFSFTLVSPSNQLGSWVPGASPTLAKFYATSAGDLRVVSATRHGFGAGSLFADTLTVTIAPRPVGQTQRAGRH